MIQQNKKGQVKKFRVLILFWYWWIGINWLICWCKFCERLLHMLHYTHFLLWFPLINLTNKNIAFHIDSLFFYLPALNVPFISATVALIDPCKLSFILNHSRFQTRFIFRCWTPLTLTLWHFTTHLLLYSGQSWHSKVCYF